MRAFIEHFLISWRDPEYSADRIMFSLSMLFGLVLINPFVETFASSRGYSFMSSVMPETAWGALLVGIALCQFWTITEQHLEGRRNVALLSMGVWLFISWGFLISNPAGTGWPVYGLLAYHSLRIYWKGRRSRWTSVQS
jgi:hypothetical protein